MFETWSVAARDGHIALEHTAADALVVLAGAVVASWEASAASIAGAYLTY